ncbi:MAG: 8-amino-7-oxononanoate synthase [Syntrophaceae bacterium]|nr:8-amino-7-oxononanoate synthase [Syntrophaceae bacterium]
MDRIKKYLSQRKEEANLRGLQPVEARKKGSIFQQQVRLIDFSSNDYLGLSRHPRLVQAAKQALKKHGVGAGASRLLSGDYRLHHELEKAVASFKRKESALVFNSGYQANLGIISSFAGKGDAVFSDVLCHASQIDGIILSRAAKFPFQHNDMEHLEELLKKERPKFDRALILTESVFSMDGDLAPLRELTELKERYNCLLMVDEAHATGVFGNEGRGRVDALNLNDRVDLVMGTFSKALGGFGAYLACSQNVTDYLINRARSFIYSTALPPAVIAANLAALDVLKEEPWRGSKLLARAEKFRQAVSKAGWLVKGKSQIVPVMVGESKVAIALAKELRSKGFYVLPIRPPSVPEGTARFRFSLCYDHTWKDLNALVAALKELKNNPETGK